MASIKLVNEEGHIKRVAKKDLEKAFAEGYSRYVVEDEADDEPEVKEFDAEKIISIATSSNTTIADLEQLVEDYDLGMDLGDYSLKAEKINAILDVVNSRRE